MHNHTTCIYPKGYDWHNEPKNFQFWMITGMEPAYQNLHHNLNNIMI